MTVTLINLPTTCFQHRTFWLKRGHAEIGNAYVVILIQQQILRFQVTVTERKKIEIWGPQKDKFISYEEKQDSIYCTGEKKTAD